MKEKKERQILQIMLDMTKRFSHDAKLLQETPFISKASISSRWFIL